MKTARNLFMFCSVIWLGGLICFGFLGAPWLVPFALSWLFPGLTTHQVGALFLAITAVSMVGSYRAHRECL